MKLRREISGLEGLKERFVGRIYNESTFVKDFFSFNRTVDNDTYFKCEKCRKETAIKDMNIKNNVVKCKCGHCTNLADIKPEVKFLCGEEVMKHNVIHGIANKLAVPMIINSRLYCNKCHESHYLDYEGYKREGETLICECGNRITFEECRIVNHGMSEYISGEVYFDGHKITLSVLTNTCLLTDPNPDTHERKMYWQQGNSRVTMNLETGYSYLIYKGFARREFQEIWRRSGHTGKAPAMCNATYFGDYSFNHLCLVARSKIRNLKIKYGKYENLYKLIQREERKLFKKIYTKLWDEIDMYMTCYLNKRYCYHVKSLKEIINGKDNVEHRPDLVDFVRHNRYINADWNTLCHFDYFLAEIKFDKSKDKYSAVDRESNSPIADYACSKLAVSKSLRKTIVNKLQNVDRKFLNNFIAFIKLAMLFKKKENVNKLFDGITASGKYLYFSSSVVSKWFAHRTEEYIANLAIGKDALSGENKFTCAYHYLSDSERLLNNIRKYYGDNFDVEFRNEKQYHDKLIEIYNSDTFQAIKQGAEEEKLRVPFTIEDECFALETEDISIARNELTLANIGNEMSICVGGYGYDVRNHNCRIAYIQRNGVYKVCLELLKVEHKKEKKVEYVLKQAKLKYNDLVGTNDEYYTIVKEWCDDNNIKIKTDDMVLRICEGAEN